MPRRLHYAFAALTVALLFGGPVAYARYRHAYLRNFHCVRDGVLYRSGQLSPDGLQRVIHDYHIKSVVTLRFPHQPGEPPPDKSEEDYCRKEEINYFRLPQFPWEAPGGVVPNEVSVRKFREIMNNPANYPVLVHCLAGTHRTGAMCAVFRMEHDRWTNEQAMEEMKLYGYDNLQEHLDLLSYLARYRPTWAQP
jgi:tyrosine-protein phosphatase SIW14